MSIFVLALIGAVVVTAIMVAARLAFGQRSKPAVTQALISWAALLFVGNLLADLLILYWVMPAITGPYGGWQWLLWPLFFSGAASIGLSGVAAGHRFVDTLSRSRLASQLRGRRVVPDAPPSWRTIVAEGSGSAGFAAIILCVIVGLVFNSIIAIATTWFDPNAHALANIPHITILGSGAQLPPTDVNHIVLVTQGIAAFKGQQVLAQNGQNLGSKFHLEQAEFTLQSVQKHLYWIAPLVYNNVFSNLGNYDTPGFVAVDAEDPDAQATLHTQHHLHYVTDALLNQELLRHVYLSGYTSGNLVDPTLEVDDTWKPYFTISLMQPSRGFTGDILSRVLLVDAESGAITSYAPADVPTFVDRVMPSDVVSQYLTWWGLYHSAPWINFSGAGQQKPASNPELVYNTADQPVWLVPMTSNNATDSSSTGIMLFDTRANSAKFYPLTGIGVGDNVNSAFSSNPQNIRNYDVSSVQLYDIFGQPTWVAIFTQANDYGETFQAVGLLSADDLSGADVQMAPSLDLALNAYNQWLATHNKVVGGGPSSGEGLKQISGTVQRIAPVTSNNTTVYYLSITGQTHIFTAPLSLSPILPLVQPGDLVTVAYVDSTNQLVTLSSFTDSSIQLGPAATTTTSP